jgi:hypothetical protein
MVDATFVEVPRQRNSREDNAKIKQGETPAEWLKQPRKLAQKDVTARWAKKNNQTFYGYKDHVKVGEKQSSSVITRQPMPVRTTVSLCRS